MLEMQPLVDISYWGLLFFLSSVVNVQESCCEDGRDTNLPLCGHLQAPDFDNGKQEDCKVGDHVDGAPCHEDLLVIDAVARLGRRPQLASWDAWPDLDG